MIERLSRRWLMLGFTAVVGLSLVASSAYACTKFQGKMTVELGSTTSTADGDNVGMAHCADPRLKADGGDHDAVASADGIGPSGLGSPTLSVKISVGTTTECASGNQTSLPSDDYWVSWNSDFARDCMVQAGGVPEYVDPTLYSVPSSGAATYTIPGLEGTGFGKYVGVCLTSVNTHGGLYVGNRAPIKVI